MPATRPFTGRRMLAIMVAFFATIIAVNGTMLSLAVGSFRGLVVENSYVASQRFNRDHATTRPRDHAAAMAQPIRSWDVHAVSQGGVLTFRIEEGDAPVEDLALEVALTRPTHGRDAQDLTLCETMPGLYVANDVTAPGQWSAVLRLADGQVRTVSVMVAP